MFALSVLMSDAETRDHRRREVLPVRHDFLPERQDRLGDRQMPCPVDCLLGDREGRRLEV